MTFRPTLSSVLRGEEAAALTPESMGLLETFAGQVEAEGALALVRDECAARQRQPGCTAGVDYLLACVCARNGETERALQTLLALGERLIGERDWRALAEVAERSLALGETQAGARLLVRAHEGLAEEPARIEALTRALRILPDDLDLGLLLAQRLGEAGEGARRRELLACLLAAFAASGRFAGLEEAALEFAEHGDLEGLSRLVQTLPAAAEQGAIEVCDQLVSIAFPVLARAGRAGACAAALRAVALAAVARDGEPGGRRFREPLVEALRQGPGAALPDAAAVIGISGVADPQRILADALDRFDRVAALPPGRAVWHDTFGASRIAADDGDTVVLDFARSKGHRMPYAAALRTLTPIPDHDLRLLLLTAPAEVVRLRAEEPAEVLARALEALGGAGDAQRLKVFLVGTDLVPAREWNSFWRRARAAAPSHPRIDVSRAFEQVYRPRAPGEAPAEAGAEEEAPLPALEIRKPARVNLATIRKFLSQHPAAEAALAQRFGRFVERVMTDDRADLVDRARAGLSFARWFPDRADEWVGVLPGLWERGLSITALAGEDEQLALLAASDAPGTESDAILSALDSRFPAVRDEAARLRARLDDAGRADLRRTLLQHGARYPGAALRLLEDELSAPDPPPDGWFLLWTALALIENRPKPSTAEKVQRWIARGGAFERALEGRPCPEEIQLKLRVLFRSWRSSDRYLLPALDAVGRLGLPGEAAAIRADRQKRTDRLFEGVGRQAEGTDLPVMTRATWARLGEELESLERELRTTIPAAIQKARELGDLSENAEYHSAKQKQANVSRLVAALQLRRARARFVDDSEYREGVAGLGTEVVLEGGEGERRSFWILGENEHHLGDNVVSFQAPVGRALVGRSVGDELELGEGAERRRWRIVSVERKLPANDL
ncbi:MAG TPA: GreA/GreB family elongation factor [Terriglobales bacterium]|nr:GreA/GreB family elongation factor [Terriglobales bacterium]